MMTSSPRSSDIRSLVDALSSSDGLEREAAIARLTVIGRRSADRLIAGYARAADNRTRVSILRVLEAIADPRALALVCDALQKREEADCAVAAAAALKPLLDSDDPACATAALDTLVEVALDTSRERRVRLAAYNALQDMPPALLGQITAAFASTAGTIPGRTAAHDAVLADAGDGRLPGDPAELRSALNARGGSLALTSLQKLIDAARDREHSARGAASGAAWLQVRAAAHQALALRGSRLALYDLRETVEKADAPLPPAFLSALRLVGDASCVEALAAALARAPEDDLWWRHQLAATLRAITKRERMTKRHASVKRALARWPQVAEAFN